MKTSRRRHRCARSHGYPESAGQQREVFMDMQGANIIVTGGASGIGRATALLLAREGARVFVGDIDEAGGRSAEAEASGGAGSIRFFRLDLADMASITAFVASVNGATASIEGLVNAAGWDKVEPF